LLFGTASQERIMLANLSAVIEEEVWRDMARIADRMSRNPRSRVGAELARTRAHLLELRCERQHQVDDLITRLQRVPNDREAKQQLELGTERLADLRVAEAILIALAD
jgi:hypothetical protein